MIAGTAGAFLLICAIAVASFAQYQSCIGDRGYDSGSFWRSASFDGSSAAARAVGRQCSGDNFLPGWLSGYGDDEIVEASQWADGAIIGSEARVCPRDGSPHAVNRLAIVGPVRCTEAARIALHYFDDPMTNTNHYKRHHWRTGRWKCHVVSYSDAVFDCWKRHSAIGATFR